MSLGEKILKLRKQKGLSQEELGDRIKVTRQTISNWELNVTNPSPKELKLLSKEFCISIDELLENDVDDNKNIFKIKTNIWSSILKILAIIFIIFLLLILIKVVKKSSRENERKIEETIHCKLYGEEHSFGIRYYELTGEPIELGGDAYFSDILDLNKYSDANQIFNIINDYVKKNGGTCERIIDNNLNDLVNMTIKDGSLTNNSATIIISESNEYDIICGEPFWIEKYNNGKWEKLPIICDNCAFNLPAYTITGDKPLELYQDWSRLYGKLPKGNYRLVKEVSFSSNLPINEENINYIWVEFNID